MQARPHHADIVHVEEFCWRFHRAGQTLEIRRRDVPEGILLVVTDSSGPRSYFFSDVEALIRFQSDMESFLVSSGWTFVQFSPERRTGRERRTFPRLEERRRWWTDGQPDVDPIETPRLHRKLRH